MSDALLETTVPYRTLTLPGPGGTFRESPTDFHVEELPLYEASGEGHHLYVTFEKVGLTTRDVVERIVRELGVPEAEVGYAGLKDKHATTRQTVSICAPQDLPLERLEGEDLRILAVNRHRNKLRVGHLRGNRFRAVIRDADADADARARAILDVLAAHGLPNAYGRQRFGARGDNAVVGMRLVLGTHRARVGRWKLKLLVSAFQSALFNHALADRMARGDLDRVHAGDVMVKVSGSAPFNCAEPEVDQARYEQREIAITGPIFGGKMPAPTPGSAPAAWEAAVLERCGVAPDAFARAGKLAPGTRRALCIPVGDPEVSAADEGLALAFTLEAGAYATVLIDEVVKPGAAAG